MANREEIVPLVSVATQWMVKQRMGKLRDALHTSMSISPFLLPIVYDLHSIPDFGQLGELLVVGHLMVGHSTSFGKFVDEKLLPQVFGTTKLSASFRAANPPLTKPCFNEIDHIVRRGDKLVLLSLKASKWTIQLTAAMELNKAFNEILTLPGCPYDQIVVGVFSGTRDSLTDKYDILAGVNRGKQHDVADLTNEVSVLAGRDFWAWVNHDEVDTQTWVLEGILDGLKQANCREECRELLSAFTASFNATYDQYVDRDGKIDWQGVLRHTNG